MTLAGILEGIETVGDTILLVSAGGCGFHFVKGVVSRSSKGARLAGGVQAVVTNKRRVGRWAAWSGVMTAMEVGLERARHVEGPLNLMVACGATNALFSAHLGTRAAVVSGLKGAAYGGVAGVAIYSIARVFESAESSN
ncbi:hypothetical protein ACQ4PT_007440 [Festuca glaucescens]